MNGSIKAQCGFDIPESNDVFDADCFEYMACWSLRGRLLVVQEACARGSIPRADHKVLFRTSYYLDWNAFRGG